MTDGQRVAFLVTPAGADDGWESGDGLDTIFRSRIEALLERYPANTDPARMLEALFYNMPLTMQQGDTFATWEDALTAAERVIRDAPEAAPPDLGLSAKGAKNPIKLPPVDDDYTPDVLWESVDPTEPHVFVPQSIVNEYTCAYCYSGPTALIHTDSMRTQVIANYGDPSEELAAYDAWLATFDDDDELHSESSTEVEQFDSSLEGESVETPEWRDVVLPGGRDYLQITLAAHLAHALKDQLTRTLPLTPYYVQWTPGGAGLQVEVVSDQFLAEQDRITAFGEARMRELGFAPPSEESPNWTMWLEHEYESTTVAEPLVTALLDVYRIPMPEVIVVVGHLPEPALAPAAPLTPVQQGADDETPPDSDIPLTGIEGWPIDMVYLIGEPESDGRMSLESVWAKLAVRYFEDPAESPLVEWLPEGLSIDQPRDAPSLPIEDSDRSAIRRRRRELSQALTMDFRDERAARGDGYPLTWPPVHRILSRHLAPGLAYSIGDGGWLVDYHEWVTEQLSQWERRLQAAGHADTNLSSRQVDAESDFGSELGPTTPTPPSLAQTPPNPTDRRDDGLPMSWLSVVELAPGSDGYGLGPWKLTVYRVSDREGWWPLAVDSDSGTGLRVSRTSDGSVVRLEVNDDRPFREVAAEYAIDPAIFGSETLWSTIHHSHLEIDRGWVWAHPHKSAPFPLLGSVRNAHFQASDPRSREEPDDQASGRTVINDSTVSLGAASSYPPRPPISESAQSAIGRTEPELPGDPVRMDLGTVCELLAALGRIVSIAVDAGDGDLAQSAASGIQAMAEAAKRAIRPGDRWIPVEALPTDHVVVNLDQESYFASLRTLGLGHELAQTADGDASQDEAHLLGMAGAYPTLPPPALLPEPDGLEAVHRFGLPHVELSASKRTLRLALRSTYIDRVIGQGRLNLSDPSGVASLEPNGERGHAPGHTYRLLKVAWPPPSAGGPTLLIPLCVICHEAVLANLESLDQVIISGLLGQGEVVTSLMAANLGTAESDLPSDE